MNTSNAEVVLCEATAFPRHLTEHQKDLAGFLDRSLESNGGRLRADAYMPNRVCLDQLIDDAVSNKDEAWEELRAWTEWLSSFLDAMGWWECVSGCVLEELKDRHAEQLWEEVLHTKLSDLTRLSGDAYAAYAPAVEESHRDIMCLPMDGMIPAILEAARRYRLYTRYVEESIVEVWPDINKELLFNPYPQGWTPRRK